MLLHYPIGQSLWIVHDSLLGSLLPAYKERMKERDVEQQVAALNPLVPLGLLNCLNCFQSLSRCIKMSYCCYLLF